MNEQIWNASTLTHGAKIAPVAELLNAVLATLKEVSATELADENLVNIAQTLKGIGAYVAVIDAEIHQRVVVAGRLIPGACTKDEVKHRKWHDTKAAEELAREEFGDNAFETSLKSPAGIEKLGDKGKQFVAVASFKPEAGKKVVY